MNAVAVLVVVDDSAVDLLCESCLPVFHRLRRFLVWSALHVETLTWWLAMETYLHSSIDRG